MKSMESRDSIGSGNIHYIDFRTILSSHLKDVNSSDIDQITRYLDTKGNGQVSYSRFLSVVRVSLSPERLGLIQSVFHRLQSQVQKLQK